MRRILALPVLVLALSNFLHGQDPSKLLERDVWRTRADILTSNLLKDASRKDVLDRALLMAELSHLWWESDQTRASGWIEKSVDAVSFYPAEDAKAESEKFFRVTRQILSLISSHDKKQSTRLSEILTKSKQLPDQEKGPTAEALIHHALQIVKEDPNKAAELGLRALNLGFPLNTYDLSLQLRRKNADVADRFFRSALSIVSAAPDRTRLHGMQLLAFPEFNNPNFPAVLKPPVELKVLFLSFVADYLYQLQSRFSSKVISSCLDEAAFTTGLRNHFTELLPEKSGVVQHAVDICLGKQSRPLQDVLAKTNMPRDVDELLRRSEEIQDNPTLRANYLFRAASAASQQKKFAKSIEILEKMTVEERKVSYEYWEELRFDSGAGLAVLQFKEGNVAGADETLRDIPEPLRPLGQITFVFQFSPEDITSYQVCVGLLNDARPAIIKSGLPFTRKSSHWLNLVKLYSEYRLQTEAAAAFREIAIAFNSFQSDDTPTNREAASNQLISDGRRIIPRFSLDLFETKEESIFQSVNLIKDESVRIQINFEFLKMTLKKYSALKTELEKKPQTSEIGRTS